MCDRQLCGEILPIRNKTQGQENPEYKTERKQNNGRKRYVGDYPVIGIRPIIDGRRGPMKLRESLEGQTMELAMAAK